MNHARRTAAAIGVVVLAGLLAAGCELQITQPAAVSAPTGPGSITITNTNTNTATTDRADTEPGQQPAPGPGGGTGGAALPLPTYGEQVTLQIAASHPALLGGSCEKTHGAQAWAFLDLVIRSLQARDPRWGYLCKDAGCSTVGADIVAYRATETNAGIWIVDVIGNHCPLPGDVVTARWGVLPFETVRRWIGVRP